MKRFYISLLFSVLTVSCQAKTREAALQVHVAKASRQGIPTHMAYSVTIKTSQGKELSKSIINLLPETDFPVGSFTAKMTATNKCEFEYVHRDGHKDTFRLQFDPYSVKQN